MTDHKNTPLTTVIDSSGCERRRNNHEVSLELRTLLDSPCWTQVHPIHGYSAEYSEPQVFVPHQHAQGKLIYADFGAVVVATEHQRWAIGPGRALWVCPGIQHWTRTVHHVRMRSVLIDASLEYFLPSNCRYINVTSLLQELIKVMAIDPVKGLVTDRAKALAALFVYELNATSV